MYKIKCENCDEMRVSRCSSAECPVELQIAANSYVSLAAENAALKALVAEMVAGIEQVKSRVTGDRHPRWSHDMHVTQSRMIIADACDALITRAKGV